MKASIATLLALLSLTLIVASPASSAQTLRIHAPSVLPRDEGLGGFAPLVSFAYSNLRSEPYTLKVWLLEELSWTCASSQWCERAFAINSSRESFSDGSLQMASPFDVYDYGPSLTWVAKLYNSSGVEVASSKVQSKTVAKKPPYLGPVGKRVGAVGQELRLRFNATAAEGEKVKFQVHDAPPGAKLEAETGVFSWTPTTPGLYRIIVEAVSSRTKLSNAEIVALDIAQAEGPDEAVIEVPGTAPLSHP